MNIAVLSDIHANREALVAVLEDARHLGADSFCSLGDIIGFNGDPAACIDIVRPLLCAAVRGNHEAALLQRGLFGVPLYTTMMDRTAAMLHAEQIAWLRSLPLQTSYAGMRLVHASPGTPETWQRIATPAEATTALSTCTEAICFFGHTHRPAVFCTKAGYCTALPICYDAEGTCTIPLEEGVRYLINPGSVGQPRDMEWKAAYALINTETQHLLLRRVAYDVHAAAAKIERTGLPPTFAEALLRGASPTGD
ncbi:MAG: metallophosphoesterase family protein [Akkermansia sp.]|nr:metallophosphoesterase family protein [Akkermansia sp.]